MIPDASVLRGHYNRRTFLFEHHIHENPLFDVDHLAELVCREPELTQSAYCSCAPASVTDVASLNGLTLLAGDFKGEDFSTLYAIDFLSFNLYKVDTTTGAVTLVYLAVSSKIVNGSPANAISTVPIMPWGAQ